MEQLMSKWIVRTFEQNLHVRLFFNVVCIRNIDCTTRKKSGDVSEKVTNDLESLTEVKKKTL